MNELAIAVLNLFVTCISIAAALPGIYEKDLRIMVITFLVLFLGKLMASVKEYGSERGIVNHVFLSIESVADIFAVAFCFHYVFVIMNQGNHENTSVLGNNFYFGMLIIVSGIHILIDFARCGIVFLKSCRTNTRISMVNK